jgi:exopolysaccharide biosynthesis polyprenyl glycosylphosphotransferase
MNLGPPDYEPIDAGLPAGVATLSAGRPTAATVGPYPAGRTTFGPDIPRRFLWLCDSFAIVAAFLGAYQLAPVIKSAALSRQVVPDPWITLLSLDVVGDYRPIDDVAWVPLVMGAITLLCIQALGGYAPLTQQSRTRVVLSTVVATVVGLGTVALVVFTVRSQNWSRLFIFLFALFAAVILCTYRLTLRWYRFKRLESGFYAKKVVLIGPGTVLGQLAGYIGASAPLDYDVVGYLGMSPGQPVEPVANEGRPLPRLGDVDDLAALAVHRPIHEVVAIVGTSGEWLKTVIDVCDYFRLTLRIIPEALLAGGLRDLRFIHGADSLRLPEVVLRPRHFDSDALFIKRLFDIVVSGFLLVVLSPLFALVAAIIKITTPHLPVFYPWKVVGYNGARISGYTFTTMEADADLRRDELLKYNEMTGPVFKIRNDPRITPFGRFLRKYSINELPQLWNVLKGDLSLVGPRPAFPHELERYELWHKRKLCVKSGLTCLWQVRGRNKISNFDDWVRMDLEYIDNWSLWLDVKIVIRTVWAVLAGTGS